MYRNYILNKNSSSDPEYNGGYSVQSLLMENQRRENNQTGGNGHIRFSQFQDMVIPIGLVLDNRCHSLTQKSVDVFDDGYEHKYVESAFFDKLLYSMNDSIKEKNSKTEKIRHSSNKKTMKK